MTKEEALESFFKALKVTFSNSSAYNKDHPYFIKSVATFKEKIDLLLAFLNPIKLNFTTDSLHIDGSYYQKEGLFQDIAVIFHMRKIKSVEIQQGVEVSEMVAFFEKVTLPPKEILRHGGLQHMLDKKHLPHLTVEDLDYSLLLRSEGEECKDIWVYLLKDSVETQNVKQVNDLADTFERMVGKFKVKDFFEDVELNTNIRQFLDHVKVKHKDKINKCGKGLLKLLLKDKDITEKYNLEHIKSMLKDFDADVFSDTIWDEITKDGDFDSLSFNLLLQLLDRTKHNSLASGLAQKAKNVEAVKDNPKLKRKLRELFEPQSGVYLPGIFRHALSMIMKNIDTGHKLYFDRNQIAANFRVLLLNLLADEANKDRIKAIVEGLAVQLDQAISQQEMEYIGNLFTVIETRKKNDASVNQLCEPLTHKLGNFMENMVFEDNLSAEYEYIIDSLKKSFVGSEFYLHKFFEEGKVTPHALKLFLRFYYNELSFFYKELQQHSGDFDLYEKVINSLQRLNSPVGIQILKDMYSFSNNIIKIEIIRSMQKMTELDDVFLFSVVENEVSLLKREALLVLRKKEDALGQALDKLFSFSNPWGRKNQLLLENISLAEELEMQEARGHLELLMKGWSLWRIPVRNSAKAVLKRWDHAARH